MRTLQSKLWRMTLSVVALSFVSAFIYVPDQAHSLVRPFSSKFIKKQAKNTPAFRPAEIIVKFKEGADPEKVLRDAGINAVKHARVHSTKRVTNEFRKRHSFEKDRQGKFLGRF